MGVFVDVVGSKKLGEVSNARLLTKRRPLKDLFRGSGVAVDKDVTHTVDTIGVDQQGGALTRRFAEGHKPDLSSRGIVRIGVRAVRKRLKQRKRR